MELTTQLQTVLDDIGLTYVETLADRRGSLALAVTRGDEPLVLKLHNSEETEEARGKARLLERESEILAGIPQLTRNLYVDHGVTGQQVWLLIRDVGREEAHQVAKAIRQENVDPAARRALLQELLVQVSEFYRDLFDGGYLHGDIQPAHTYLEDGQIAVIDWGLARTIEEPNPLYKGGFVYFVAPEIAEQMPYAGNKVEYSTAAEVYALGATLFLLYTGSMTLDFGAPKAELKSVPMEHKLERVRGNDLLSFESVGADAYPELEELLRTSLSTDPTKRFANPIELHQQLSGLSPN